MAARSAGSARRRLCIATAAPPSRRDGPVSLARPARARGAIARRRRASCAWSLPAEVVLEACARISPTCASSTAAGPRGPVPAWTRRPRRRTSRSKRLERACSTSSESGRRRATRRPRAPPEGGSRGCARPTWSAAAGCSAGSVAWELVFECASRASCAGSRCQTRGPDGAIAVAAEARCSGSARDAPPARGAAAARRRACCASRSRGTSASTSSPPCASRARGRASGAGAARGVPLRELARGREDGKTWIELARPRGLVPAWLRVETTSAAFVREVRVCDSRPGDRGPAPRRGEVFRVTDVEHLEVPLDTRRAAIACASRSRTATARRSRSCAFSRRGAAPRARAAAHRGRALRVAPLRRRPRVPPHYDLDRLDARRSDRRARRPS